MEYKYIKIWAIKMWVWGEGWGKNLASGWYTPLYKNGIKKTQNKSMETSHIPRKRTLPHIFLVFSRRFPNCIQNDITAQHFGWDDRWKTQISTTMCILKNLGEGTPGGLPRSGVNYNSS